MSQKPISSEQFTGKTTVWPLICCRIPVLWKMPRSCQRFSSGGLLGKLFLKKNPHYKASAESLHQQYVLVYNNLCALLLMKCVSHVLAVCSGLLWKDIAPHWQQRTCGPWGRKTPHTRSSLSCSRTGRLNVPKFKSKKNLLLLLLTILCIWQFKGVKDKFSGKLSKHCETHKRH